MYTGRTAGQGSIILIIVTINETCTEYNKRKASFRYYLDRPPYRGRTVDQRRQTRYIETMMF